MGTAHPAVCAALSTPARRGGKQQAGGGGGRGEGGWGSCAAVPAVPWHSSAQHTKERVSCVPLSAAEGLGWGEEGGEDQGGHTQKGWLSWDSLSHTLAGRTRGQAKQSSPRDCA